MNLKDIISISGEAGLFRFIAQGRNGIIVEHLETGKRHNAPASARVSSLDEIAVFTDGEEMKLSIVFDRIFEKENGGPAPDPKSSPGIQSSYFGSVVPEYDKNRVYASDIKKVLLWYNILHKLNMLIKEEKSEEGATPAEHRDEIKTESAPEAKRIQKVHEKKSVVKKGAGVQAPKRISPSQRKSG